MKKKTPSVSEVPQSITKPVLISTEMEDQHRLLKRDYERARNNLSMRRGKPGKGLLEEEEVARSNLRAFERKNGLEPS